MQVLSAAEVHDLMNVTPHTFARHCGLASDPSNPDDRSEEQRCVALNRQLGLVRTWPSPNQTRFTGEQRHLRLSGLDTTNLQSSEFSANYLPELIAKYKSYTGPSNIAVTTINVICHLPYFVRYQRTHAASDLVVLQANRIVNEADGPSDPKDIGDICQLLSTLLVLQGQNALPEDTKKELVRKIDRWRSQYKGQFSGEVSDRWYQYLKGTRDMVGMSKMMKEMLEKPLEQCGARGCDHRVGSVGSGLNWPEHKSSCYVTTF